MDTKKQIVKRLIEGGSREKNELVPSKKQLSLQKRKGLKKIIKQKRQEIGGTQKRSKKTKSKGHAFRTLRDLKLPGGLSKARPQSGKREVRKREGG